MPFGGVDVASPNRDQEAEEALARAQAQAEAQARADAHARAAGRQKPYERMPPQEVAVAEATPRGRPEATPTSQAAAEQAPTSPRSYMDMTGWFAPEQAGNYWAVWTFAFTLATCFLFAFMAGQYSTYQVKQQLVQVAKGTATAFKVDDITWGPSSLQSWLQFYSMAGNTTFDFEYLQAWGGRYGPDLATGRWWEILTSIFLHSSFSHILSNMVLFVILSTPLEHSYGTARIFAVWLVAGLAGSLASAAWEAPCSLVVGASGSVFGLVALFLADIVVNFESIFMPMARLAAMVVGLVFLIVLQVVDSGSGNKSTSHMSHVGGFIAGLFVSLLFLPNFKDRRWRLARKQAKQQGLDLPRHWTHEYSEYQSVWTKHPKAVLLINALGVCVMVVFFVVLPIYLWRGKLVGLTC